MRRTRVSLVMLALIAVLVLLLVLVVVVAGVVVAVEVVVFERLCRHNDRLVGPMCFIPTISSAFSITVFYVISHASAYPHVEFAPCEAYLTFSCTSCSSYVAFFFFGLWTQNISACMSCPQQVA